MPSNIDYLKNSLPLDSKLTLQNGNTNLPGNLGLMYQVKRIGTKVLPYSIGLASAYGAYKLGRNYDSITGKFNKIKSGIFNAFGNSRKNRTYSGT